jgi:hypothetical protein
MLLSFPAALAATIAGPAVPTPIKRALSGPNSGLLEPEGLTLTMAGRDALVEAYPELEPQMLRQGDLLSSGVI